MIAFIYVVALCLANVLVFWLGPWWSIVNSFLLIGLDFVIRDSLHEKLGLFRVSGLAVAAGVISYAINPAGGAIAIASCTSFVIASLGDGFVYQSLIKRPWSAKSNASNTAAAAIDSLLFPWIAFGTLMPQIVLAQFFAKVLGGFLWSMIIPLMRKS